MPAYAYECTVCNHKFEVFQSMTAPPVTKCERCGAKVRRLVSAVAISFKGAGAHSSDYASETEACPTCCTDGSCSWGE